jgi:tetratricopeptide (TPR) repeat protein
VAGLRVKLNEEGARRLTKRGTENTDAYDAYLRGRFLLVKRTGPAVEKGIEYFEKSVKLDPNFAPAYAGLSYAYWSLGGLGVRLPKEVLPKANEAVAKALALDDTLAEAYSALGHIRQTERDWTESAFRRATELDPNSGFAHSNYAFYFIAMRRFDEAIVASKRAVELEPTSVLYNRNAAMMLYFARRYDEAIEQARKTLELNPDMPTAYRWLAKSCEQKGLYDQAVEAHLKVGEFSIHGPEGEAALRQAYAVSGWNGFWRKGLDLKNERAKQRNVSPHALAEIYARLGEKDQALAWLERDYERGSWNITALNADPIWDGLRSDPRYADLVRRIGLEP